MDEAQKNRLPHCLPSATVFLHSGVSDNRTIPSNYERLRRVALLGLRLPCLLIGAVPVQRLARQLLVRKAARMVGIWLIVRRWRILELCPAQGKDYDVRRVYQAALGNGSDQEVRGQVADDRYR